MSFSVLLMLAGLITSLGAWLSYEVGIGWVIRWVILPFSGFRREGRAARLVFVPFPVSFGNEM